MIEIAVLGPGDDHVLADVAPGVFDHALRPELVSDFLADPRHHLVVARAGGTVVGFASGVHYVHPDKMPELWVNEIGVAEAERGQGIGAKLMRALFEVGRVAGCREAWLVAERGNGAARRLYESVGGAQPGDEPVVYEFVLSEGSGADGTA